MVWWNRALPNQIKPNSWIDDIIINQLSQFFNSSLVRSLLNNIMSESKYQIQLLIGLWQIWSVLDEYLNLTIYKHDVRSFVCGWEEERIKRRTRGLIEDDNGVYYTDWLNWKHTRERQHQWQDTELMKVRNLNTQAEWWSRLETGESTAEHNPTNDAESRART